MQRPWCSSPRDAAEGPASRSDLHLKHTNDQSGVTVPKLTKPRLWDEVPIVIAVGPSEDLLSIDRNMILANFKKYGIVLFRSFSVGIERFRAIVRSYSGKQISYPGSQRLPVSQDGKVQKVAAGVNAIPLHSELSHTPFRPDICWFYCVKAPARGSETMLCDGSILASALLNPTRDLLEGRMLRYRRTTSIGFLQRLLNINDAAALQEFLTTGSYSQYYELHGNHLRQDFLAPALHNPKFLHTLTFSNNIIHNFRSGRPLLYPTFEDGSTIPESVIVNIRDTARRSTFEIQWRDEDLLMFDNTRFMHGRRAIIDPHRTIWTQFSDADFLSERFLFILVLNRIESSALRCLQEILLASRQWDSQ